MAESLTYLSRLVPLVKEGKCAICGLRPARPNGTLCQTCADQYSELLRSQRAKIGEMNSRIAQITGAAELPAPLNDNLESDPKLTQAAQTLLSMPVLDRQQSEAETQALLSESKLLRKQKRTATLVGYVLLALGLITCAASIILSSTVSAFVGLGLTLWGMLSLFIQPKNYVKTDLMNATAISSLKTIDKMMVGIGYREKGVYIPAGEGERALVFVPSEPFARIPQTSQLEGRTFLEDPDGLVVPPPGLALAGLIEKKLGFKLKNCGLETLVEALPKVLVEDLEIVRDLEIEVTGDAVKFRLFDSIYANFCSEVRDSSRRCGLGCPMCSALAVVLASATGRPVVYEEDKSGDEKNTSESTYRIIRGSRL